MEPLIIVGAVFGALLTWVLCKYSYDERRRAYRNAPKPARDTMAESPIPIGYFEANGRYDIICTVGGEARLYEGVRVLGIRTFDRILEYGGAIGGLVELEAVGGARMMIPQHSIQMVCPAGSHPAFRKLGASLPADETRTA